MVLVVRLKWVLCREMSWYRWKLKVLRSDATSYCPNVKAILCPKMIELSKISKRVGCLLSYWLLNSTCFYQCEDLFLQDEWEGCTSKEWCQGMAYRHCQYLACQVVYECSGCLRDLFLGFVWEFCVFLLRRIYKKKYLFKIFIWVSVLTNLTDSLIQKTQISLFGVNSRV